MGRVDPRRRCLPVAPPGHPATQGPLLVPRQACKLPGGTTLDLAAFLELQSALEAELRSRERLCQELSVVKVANQTFAR